MIVNFNDAHLNTLMKLKDIAERSENEFNKIIARKY